MHWWHIAVFMAIMMLPYVGEWFVRRAKRTSLKWQGRSERQQRQLARLPGLGVCLIVFALLEIFNVPW